MIISCFVHLILSYDPDTVDQSYVCNFCLKEIITHTHTHSPPKVRHETTRPSVHAVDMPRFHTDPCYILQLPSPRSEPRTERCDGPLYAESREVGWQTGVYLVGG